MLKERLIKAAEDRGAECAFVVKDLKDGSVCAYREDEVVSGLAISDVKKVSENFMDGYFQVPKVLGEGV